MELTAFTVNLLPSNAAIVGRKKKSKIQTKKIPLNLFRQK